MKLPIGIVVFLMSASKLMAQDAMDGIPVVIMNMLGSSDSIIQRSGPFEATPYEMFTQSPEMLALQRASGFDPLTGATPGPMIMSSSIQDPFKMDTCEVIYVNIEGNQICISTCGYLAK